MIKNKVFNHSNLPYHYRLHSIKTENLAKDYSALKIYLNNIITNCPNDYFNSGPRSSSLNFKIDFDIKSITGHEISTLARYALDSNNLGLDEHSKVENFMIENDNKTIAIEIPLWIKNDEIKNFKTIFKSSLPLTGHIDILRIEDNKIWIWDYKPRAKDEKYASTQVYFYAIMLSKRTNIPLSNFMCGYFNKDYSFIFKPKEEMIKFSRPLAKFF